MLLSARQRLELCRPREVRARAVELLLPDLPHVVGLPDEVRRPVERRDEVVRDASRGQSLGPVRNRRLDQVGTTLRGRVDDCALDVVQRSLRERRERAQRLDLVAEELDTQRVAAGRREDVDEAAANRELAALLGAIDALVAGKREPLGEGVEARRA